MSPGPAVIEGRAAEAGPVVAVIVNYNSGPWLARCLAALAVQTRPPDRIVVMDNASSDGSEGAAAADPRVELVRMDSNLGFAEANNRAVARAVDAAWLALVNPDAEPEPDWLECLLAAAEAHPEAGAFASLTLMSESSELADGMGDDYHISGLVWRRGHGRRLDELDRSDGEVFSACAAAALFRKAAWDEVGGMDADYFCYLEDVDVCFRMRLAGWTVRLVGDAVARHAGSAIAGAGSDFALYHGQRNLVWTFFKNLPAGLLLLLVPFHLAALAWLVIRRLSTGQAGPLVRGIRDAVATLPAVAAKRSHVQRRRRVGALKLLGMFRWGLKRR